MTKIVINRCFGGFGLSEAAYLRLAEYGVPIRAYIEEKRNPETGLYEREPANAGECIFDRTLSAPKTGKEFDLDAAMTKLSGRYWDCWTKENRAHPLVVRVVEELGKKAGGKFSELAVVEIPDGVEWEIDEYDGNEHIAEVHRTWR